MRSRAILLPLRVRSASGKLSKYASTWGVMSITSAVRPRRSHTATASICDWGSLLRYGMNTGTTLSAPSDATASAVTSDESIPPERPTMTRSNPTLRTPSAMKPRSRSMMKAASTASASASESIGLGVVDIVSFVTKERIRDSRAPERAAFEAVEENGFLRAMDLGNHAAGRVDHTRTAPEPDAILEPGSVAVQDIRGEQLRIGASHHVVAARRADGISLEQAAAG